MHLGGIINIIKWCIQCCVIITDNVKSVNEPRPGCVLFKPHHRYVCDAIFYIHFSCFPLQKLCFALFFWTDKFCAWLSCIFCVIWRTVLVAPISYLIDRLSFTFDSQLTLFFQLLYCIPTYSLSLLLNPDQNMIFFARKVEYVECL